MVRLFSPTRASALSRSAAGPCRHFVPDPGVNVVGDEDRMQPVKIAEARATGEQNKGDESRARLASDDGGLAL
jgi:hypothetical protein